MARIRIGIDAGHGGTSSGTNSCGKLYEKSYTLSLAKLVKDRLIHNGFDVYMPRVNDTNVGKSYERGQMCVNAKCDYAVSLHFNGFPDKSANGCEVFVPYGETSAKIEVGYKKYLSEFFKIREPFSRSSNINNQNEIFDKKMNDVTKKFEATSNKKDYFGFIRTAWENGLSADLLEVCFLTNQKDFDTYTKNESTIADAIACSIVEGYDRVYKPLSNTTITQNTKGKYIVQVGSDFTIKEQAERLKKYIRSKGLIAKIREIE